ncbi:putative gustatory receptor 28b [Anoplophora glabripennis]|uniref:putative gustatory receptor 28b n=1 Tax=Anoplophora glabripennis TaxID=217634 RepID=UPI0008736DC3|nr:putative gustatory receptor 28b [Anoplophora glabripennis]
MIDILHVIYMNQDTDSDLSEVVNALILQTHHQIIEFSLFGALHLDGNLIYSIFGALTTYLIILLQFDINY